MFIELTDAERRLAAEADEYFSTLLTEADYADLRRDEYGEAARYAARRMGADGWLGIGWPEEYGGRGLGPVADQIVLNAAFRYDVPFPLVTVHSIGSAIRQWGTDAQRAEFLPRILRGEIHFSVGYSEPSAGTDAAAIKTAARREGDAYVVNGQKTFTSGVHTADYVWLSCRTSEEEKKHRGLTILIVDTKSPGFSTTPMATINGARAINATYLDNVRVPVSLRVGDEGEGWKLITGQLNSERYIVGLYGRVAAHYDRFLDWARAAVIDGSPAVENPAVRRALARCRAVFRTNELLNWRTASGHDEGAVGAAQASVGKVYNSERLAEVGTLIIDTVQRVGDPTDPATAALLDVEDFNLRTEFKYPVGGGVSEIQRELISMLGLGLPRPIR